MLYELLRVSLCKLNWIWLYVISSVGWSCAIEIRIMGLNSLWVSWLHFMHGHRPHWQPSQMSSRCCHGSLKGFRLEWAGGNLWGKRANIWVCAGHCTVGLPRLMSFILTTTRADRQSCPQLIDEETDTGRLSRLSEATLLLSEGAGI